MKFNGDLDSLEEVHTNKIIEVLEKNGFTQDTNVTIEAVGLKGDNYVAQVKRVLAEDKDGKTLRMIAKIASSLEAVRQMMQMELMFMNEIIMYTEVLPGLAKLQNGLEIPEKDKLRFPICYGVVTEAPNEFILLEDLKTQDFEMRDRMVSLTDEELKMILNRLAIMHSHSFVLKEKEPKLFSECSEKLRNMWNDSNDDTNNFFALIETGVIQVLEEEEYKIRTRGTLSQMGKLAGGLYTQDVNSKYAVIIHGDCWTNNVMFRFEEDQPADCMLIDYQISRVSSPALELIYLIFNCTDRETRSKHFYDWLDYYHRMLDDSLSNFGLKTSSVYPRDKLDADLRRYGKLGYAMSLLLANVFIRESAEVIDIDSDPQTKMEEMMNNNDLLGLGNCKEETVIKLKARLNDTCKSFMEYGYI